MAEQPIDIRIRVTADQLGGLDVFARRFQEFRRAFGEPQRGPAGQALYNVALNLQPGSTAGLTQLQQLTQQTDAQRRVYLSAAQAVTGGYRPTLGQIAMTGFQELSGPYGGLRASGYTGGLPPPMPQMPPLINATYVRPGGVRPWPAGLGASPFGSAAGGPPGVAPLPGATPPSGRFSPWYPGYGLGYGAAGLPGWTPPSRGFSPWYPGYGLGYGAAGMPPGMTPPTGPWSHWAAPVPPPGAVPGPMTTAPMHTVSPPPGWTAPSGAFSAWPGTFGQRAMGYAGLYAPQIPGMVGQGVAGAYGMLHDPARRTMQVGGALMGVGVYQSLTEAMELYRQRAKGVIDVGMQLDTNFKQVGESVDRLRTRYAVLAHDAFGAIAARGRITGEQNPAATENDVGFGVAYGMDPARAATLGATMRMMGGNRGIAPMLRLAASARESYGRGGGLPMEMGALQEAGVRMMSLGGAAAPAISPDIVGNWQGFIANLGTRYRMPGEMEAAYGRFAEGMGPAQDPTTQGLRFRITERWAARRQAAGLGSTIDIGDLTNVPLNTLLGRKVAMENVRNLPDLQEEGRRFVSEMAGPSLTERVGLFNQVIFGGRLSDTEALRVYRNVKPGTFAGMGRPGNMAAEDVEAVKRLTLREHDPSFAPQKVAAGLEAGLETLGRPLVDANNQLKQVLIDLTKTLQEGRPWEALQKAMTDLQTPLAGLAGVIIALGSNSTAGQALGTLLIGNSLMGTGIFGTGTGLPPAQPGFDYPVLGDPFGTVPGRQGPSLVPQRRAP
jgi:hypothetical protein